MIRSCSTDDDPSLVLIDYDRVMKMSAAMDFGSALAMDEAKPYPALANRRAAAQAYVEAVGASVTDGLGRCSGRRMTKAHRAIFIL